MHSCFYFPVTEMLGFAVLNFCLIGTALLCHNQNEFQFNPQNWKPPSVCSKSVCSIGIESVHFLLLTSVKHKVYVSYLVTCNPRVWGFFTSMIFPNIKAEVYLLNRHFITCCKDRKVDLKVWPISITATDPRLRSPKGLLVNNEWHRMTLESNQLQERPTSCVLGELPPHNAQCM